MVDRHPQSPPASLPPGEPPASTAAEEETGPASVTVGDLVELHLGAVYAYAFRLSRSSGEAEELTQQVFLLAQQRLHQLRSPDRARSWLLTITRNAYLKTRLGRRPVTATDLELDLGSLIEEPEPPDTGPVDAERLHRALGELPEHYRTVLLMFFFEELTYQQIADVLAVPAGTVMSRLSRGKQLLRGSLSRVAVFD